MALDLLRELYQFGSSVSVEESEVLSSRILVYIFVAPLFCQCHVLGSEREQRI